jgi:tetratricopeptide (TPR) repeat protein
MNRVLTLMLLVALPLAAQAQSYSALLKEGERLYQQGEYRKSAELLIQANELSPNARLLYNIARAFDQAGDARKAVSYYQQYVNSTEGTDSQLLKRAGLALDRLRRQIEKEEAATAALEAERKRLEQETAAARARADAEAQTARRASEESQRTARLQYEQEAAGWQRSRIAAFGLGGLALVSAGVGTWMGLQAGGTLERFRQATLVEEKRTLSGDVRNQALLTDISFGVAVVAAATAVLLYPKGPAPEPPAGTASIILAPSGLGAGVEVKF